MQGQQGYPNQPNYPSQQQTQQQPSSGYPSRPIRPMARPMYPQARPVRPTTIPDGDSPTSPTAGLVQPMSNLNVKQQRPVSRAKRVYQDAYLAQGNEAQAPPQTYPQTGYTAPAHPQAGAYPSQSQQPYYGGPQQPMQPDYQSPASMASSNPIQPGYSQPSLSQTSLNNYPQSSVYPQYPMTNPPPSGSTGQIPANGYTQPPQPPPRSKIDPDQIPSPISVQEADQEMFQGKMYDTSSCTLPPLASTYFAANGYTSCNPRFMRLTLNQFPCSDELLSQSGLPMGVIIEPLANLDPRDAGVPVVDLGENGPPRCNRCKAYVNPSFRFIDGGRKFICNICTFENTCPTEYFSNLDMNGQRVDVSQRHELVYGSVEFVASKEYIAKPPKPCSIIFAMDVSSSAVKNQILSTCAATIKDFLYSGSTRLEPGVKVAIATFDKALHFYNLSCKLDQPQMMVVADVSESFLPLEESVFLVDPYESQSVIENLLDGIPTIFANNSIAEPALGASIETCYEALKHTGGRIIVFQSALPTFGPGLLKSRNDVKLLGTDKEKTLYEPQEYFWRKMGQQCATTGIFVDMFLFANGGNAYMDVATVGCLSSLTGGDIYFYPEFETSRDCMKFANDLKYLLSRPFGYDALLRVRVSNGLKIEDHFGNFYMKNATDLEIAGIDSLKAIGVSLRHDGKLEEKEDSCIQCALLYTTSSGQRRIRVHNLRIINTASLANVFKNAQMDTTINFLMKSMIAKMATVPIKTLREQLGTSCVKVLTSYRLNCATSSQPGQLILPESFKLFPLYVLSILKQKCFRWGLPVPADLRVYHMRLINGMGVYESVPLIYPRMFSLHDMSDQVGEAADYSRLSLPPMVRLSGERLDTNGAYLLENGQALVLWLGRGVSADFLQQVFDVSDIQAVDIHMRLLPNLETKLSRQIRAVMNQVRAERPRYLHLQIIRQQIDVLLEKEMSVFLVEDQTVDNMSYVDYLCAVHRNIQSEISQIR